MSFFDSDIVQEEMKVIQTLQEKVDSNVFAFSTMGKDDKMEHINALEKLLEKQTILYKRLSLSDDPKAKAMKQQIVDSASMFGLPKDADLSIMFGQMHSQISHMRKALDES